MLYFIVSFLKLHHCLIFIVLKSCNPILERFNNDSSLIDFFCPILLRRLHINFYSFVDGQTKCFFLFILLKNFKTGFLRCPLRIAPLYHSRNLSNRFYRCLYLIIRFRVVWFTLLKSRVIEIETLVTLSNLTLKLGYLGLLLLTDCFHLLVFLLKILCHLVKLLLSDVYYLQ